MQRTRNQINGRQYATQLSNVQVLSRFIRLLTWMFFSSVVVFSDFDSMFFFDILLVRINENIFLFKKLGFEPMTSSLVISSLTIVLHCLP